MGRRQESGIEPVTGGLVRFSPMETGEENRQGRLACLKAGDRASIVLILNIPFAKTLGNET